MRHFIRHPFSIPITYDVDEHTSPHHDEGSTHIDDLKDISQGGLSFKTHDAIEVGTDILVRIAISDPPFEGMGTVRWCNPIDDLFVVGVQFDDKTVNFTLRMIEQVCYIEEYRKNELLESGRELSSNEAAMEWIKKYSAEFPEI